MADVFISYSDEDEEFAKFMYKHLTDEGLSVFMASISLIPGQKWSQEILQNLKSSLWVLFLASKAACKSPFVQQEIGATIITEKRLVPIVWDMDPSDLPGWANQVQALNLRGASVDEVHHQISKIADRIKADKSKGYLIAGLLIAGLLIFLGSRE